MTHPALDESELYDDPAPDRVAPLPAVASPASAPDHSPPAPGPSKDIYMAAISAAMGAVSQRLILLVAVLGAIGFFGLATWYPDPWRLGAASAFAVIVVIPLIFVYARR